MKKYVSLKALVVLSVAILAGPVGAAEMDGVMMHDGKMMKGEMKATTTMMHDGNMMKGDMKKDTMMEKMAEGKMVDSKMMKEDAMKMETMYEKMTSKSKKDDVRKLQAMLIKEGHLKIATTTGMYGKMTQKAMMKYKATKMKYKHTHLVMRM